LLNFFEERDEFRSVLTLDVIAAIIKNVDHGVIVQSQNGARIECKPMLQGYFYTRGSENCGGLLDGHKQFKSLRREPYPVKPTGRCLLKARLSQPQHPELGIQQA